jgi:hypothetical protein
MWRGAAALVVMLGVCVPGAPSARAKEFAEVVSWLGRLQAGVKGTYAPAEAKVVDWRLAWAENGGEGAARRGEIAVTGPGVTLRMKLELFEQEQRLRWRVNEGRVDLGAWLPVLAARPELADALAGITATGELVIAGAGEWTGEAVKGEMTVALNDAVLRNAEQDWALEGVSVSVGGDVADLVAGRVPLALDVRTITTGRFGARALAVRAALAEWARIDVASATVEIAGGRVTAKPFVVALAQPKLAVDLAMERVGLQDVAALVPDFLADGRGRVNGAVRINWSQAAGIDVGSGYMEIDPSERAEVRFRPNPGLLTSTLPPQVLELYPGLTNVEMGKATLLAEQLEVRLSPEGDAEGRSATVVIAGGPVDKTLKAPLVLRINVRGPLAPLVTFGSNIKGMK